MAVGGSVPNITRWHLLHRVEALKICFVRLGVWLRQIEGSQVIALTFGPSAIFGLMFFRCPGLS